MYNSQNLPLSKKKIYKKSLPGLIAIFVFGLFISALILITALSFRTSFGAITLIIISAWAALIIFFGLPIWIYQYYYCKLYYYNFEEASAEIKKGVIKQATGIVNYWRIQNIYVDQDLLDRIFGLYDIHYETAGETSRFYSHVDGLEKENADKLVNFLKEKVHGNPASGQPMNMNNNIEEKQEENDSYKDVTYTREEMKISKAIVYKNLLTNLFYGVFMLIVFYLILIKDGIGLGDDPWISIMLVLYVLGTPFFSVIYSMIWYKNFEFKFDAKTGFIKTKVLSQKMTYIYYDRIQNINIDQSFIDRIFKIYTVNIENAADGGNSVATQQGMNFRGMTVPGLDKEAAEKLKDFLMDRSKKYKQTF